MEYAAESNLKQVTLELGGKSRHIIVDDADLDPAVSWAALGVLFVSLPQFIHDTDVAYMIDLNRFNQCQVCTAGTRIFLHEKIFDKFLEAFTAKMKAGKIGDPFAPDTILGPQVTQTHFDVRTVLKDDTTSNDDRLWLLAYHKVYRTWEEGGCQGP